MMPDMETLKSSADVWDTVAFWTGILGFTALLGQFIVEFTSAAEALGAWLNKKFNRKVDWVSYIKKALVLLVIASAGTQIVAQFNIAAGSSQMVALLDDKASAANKRAAEANKLAGDAFEQGARAIERAAALEKENLQLRIQVGVLESHVRPRQLDEKQRAAIVAIGGDGQTITVVRLNDAEPRLYADQIVAALRSARFVVKTEEITKTPPYTGLIFCEKDSRDLKAFGALRNAIGDSKIVRLGERGRPELCDAPGIELPIERLIAVGSFGYLTPEAAGRVISRGTWSLENSPRIFVGHRTPTGPVGAKPRPTGSR